MPRGNPNAARPLVARAYLVFAQMGAPEAQQPAGLLAEACGSADAANAYMAEIAHPLDDPSARL